MFRDFIYEKYINISIEKIDNFLKQKNINISINEIQYLFGDDYCLNVLSKCKKKKGYLCLQCLNKKTKKCKIHKSEDKYFDCGSRCNTPVLEDNSKDDNIYSENEEYEIKEKYDSNEFVNKDNSNIIDYFQNNNDNISYKKEKINTSIINPKNDKLPDFELPNYEVTENNELPINDFMNKLIKINSQNIEQILNNYDYYIEHKKDKYLEHDTKNNEDLFDLVDCMDGYISIKQTKNVWKVIKPFMIDCLNKGIDLNNNHFKLLFNSIFEYTKYIVSEYPLLTKLILNSDDKILDYYIDNINDSED